MEYKVVHVSVGNLTRVLGLLYACIGVIFIPFFIVMCLVDPDIADLGLGFAMVMPVFYAIIGALSGAIGGALYNLVAKAVGGVELRLDVSRPDFGSHQGAPN